MLGSGSLVCVIRRIPAPEIINSGAASVSIRRPTAICSRLSGLIGGLMVGLMASTTPVQSVPSPYSVVASLEPTMTCSVSPPAS